MALDGGMCGAVRWARSERRTITIDITPEVKAALARQAAAEGREVESYAASLLEQAVHPAAAPPTPPAKDVVELFAPLRGLHLDFERDRDTG